MGLVGYFEFQGVKYGIGTVVKIPSTLDLRWLPRDQIMVETVFMGGCCFSFTNRPGSMTFYNFSGKYESYIEIIQPVYYEEPDPPKQPNIFFRTKSGTWDAHNDVCVGFIWYVLVMLLAIIFKDCVGIWIVATIVYFSWKSEK